MSRFFAASDSSDSETSDEELYSNEEESEQEGSEMDSDSDSGDDSDSSGSAMGAAKFLKSDDESSEESEEDDGAKVLKSAKDKRFDELEAVIRQIELKQNIADWAAVSDRTCTLRKSRRGSRRRLRPEAVVGYSEQC